MSAQIVVGLDGSDDSRNALRWALDEASRRDAEVTALFAWELPMVGIPGAFDRDELESSARAFVTGQVNEVHTNGVTVTAVVAQGDPSSSLLDACRRVDAEMLVLGSRGRGGFKGLLLGSVGQECASHAPCPVLICKAHGDAPA